VTLSTRIRFTDRTKLSLGSVTSTLMDEPEPGKRKLATSTSPEDSCRADLVPRNDSSTVIAVRGFSGRGLCLKGGAMNYVRH
jgi:hypothetical protein